MSLRRYLVCSSLAHAALVDQFACEYFRDVDGNKGGQWSGVWVKPGLLSDTYAIGWEPQLAAVYGDPPSDPTMSIEEEVVDENGDSNWQPLPPPEVEEELSL